jgi:hypothetical protein
MAKEMQDYFTDRMRNMQAKAAELPREVQEPQGRIARLRRHLKSGDPDMPADELQAAIDGAERKRRWLQAQQLGENAPVSKTLATMPRAAELYRRQVAQGLDGNPQAAQKARLFLREWFGGKIRLEPLARRLNGRLESKHPRARQRRSRGIW